MASKMLNIEVGEHITKVCVCVKNRKSFRIVSNFMFAPPPESVSDGQVMNPTALAETLREKLAEHGAADLKQVTFSVCSSKIASREIMLPNIKESRISTVIETNASDYFPVDMSGYTLANNVLERVTGENAGLRVLVMAAPKMLLEGYMQLAQEAALTIESIDYCGNSQYQVLRAIQSDAVTMYVDVNTTTTFVTVIDGGIQRLQRSIAIGGDEIISTALQFAKREDSEYLKTLSDLERGTFVTSVMTGETRDECLSRIVNGIVRSADFYKTDHTAKPVSKVVLMGPCSHISGLKELVAAETGMDTEYIQDLPGLNIIANSADSLSSYISCVGSLVSPCELLPDELRRQKKGKGKKESSSSIGSAVAFLVLMFVIGAGLTGWAVYRYMTATEENATLTAQRDSLLYVNNDYDKYIAYKTTDDNVQIINELDDLPNARLKEFFEELEMKLPKNVLVLSAFCDNDGVTLNLSAPGFEEADNVISQLRAFTSLGQISVSTITETTDDAGITEALFSVICSYHSLEEGGED